MPKIFTYTKLVLLSILLLSFTACDSEEETEYNLPGEWYTSEEITLGYMLGAEGLS